MSTEVAVEPPHHCDLVLKGGLTSGVLYPPAIVELSKDHRFHSIGGSSVGAVAAAGAAAAEYGRRTGSGTGFDGLAGLPEKLSRVDRSGRTLLQRLFTPEAITRPYFDAIWRQKAMGRGTSLRDRVRPVLGELFRQGPALPRSVAGLVATVGPLAAAGAVLVAIPDPRWIDTAYLVLSAIVISGTAYSVTRIGYGVGRVARAAERDLTDNYFGLCTGRPVDGELGLTDWLHSEIEDMAGDLRYEGDLLTGSPRPLCYGDLAREDIQLITLTTNLSQQSSDNFPFVDDTWAFKVDDMNTLMPGQVASYLERRGEKATADDPDRQQLDRQGLLKLPPADELPVIMGARISLSFPGFISAIPLWRRNAKGRYEKVWLSDGGICSNLPAHLFDSPLPGRPTYAINLSTGATDVADYPAGPEAHARAHVLRPTTGGPSGGAPIAEIDDPCQLFAAVYTTLRNWSDNSTTEAIGVRDRICTVQLGRGEGGFNLDMSPTTMEGLKPRGVEAGRNLGRILRGDETVEGYLADPGWQWNQHRWTRFRSVAAALTDYIERIDRRLNPTGVDAAQRSYSYRDLAEPHPDLAELPFRHEWRQEQAERLIGGYDGLVTVDFGDHSGGPPVRPLSLSTRAGATAPKPPPEPPAMRYDQQLL